MNVWRVIGVFGLLFLVGMVGATFADALNAPAVSSLWGQDNTTLTVVFGRPSEFDPVGSAAFPAGELADEGDTSLLGESSMTEEASDFPAPGGFVPPPYDPTVSSFLRLKSLSSPDGSGSPGSSAGDVIPEPSTLLLLALGVIGLAGLVRWRKTFLKLFIMVLLINVCVAGISSAQPSEEPLLLPAEPFDRNNIELSYHKYTGKVSFLRAKPGRSIQLPQALPEPALPEEAARSFLEAQGSLFGLQNQATELTMMRGKTASRGRSVVRFQQVYQGIPIIGGELNVQMDAARNILAVNGEILPDPDLETTAAISADTARQTALAEVAEVHQVNVEDLNATEPQLWIYDRAIMLGIPGRGSRLVWRMDVRLVDLGPINEFVLIDAQTGVVVLHFNQIDAVKDRDTYSAQHGTSLPGVLKRSEGQPPIGNKHVDKAHKYAGHTYDFYWNEHGRDSINDAGMTLVSTVKYGVDYCNAFWNGSQMVYGDGCFLIVDDVVAHEITHGVTQYESNLVYAYQSGAINESLSDIWGEFVDLTNGAGNDAASVRWDIGEDTSIGAIRDMKNPGLHGDPSRMRHSNYYCGNADNGGVHSNSGVGNKLAYLLTDGGTFNGYTITGMGISKVADLFYFAQTSVLTSASDYFDLANSLIIASVILGYTPAETQDVIDAALATEMDQSPCPNGTLDCGSAVTLAPGHPYSGNTIKGASNIYHYGGGDPWPEGVPWYDPGPEVVHKFTTTSTQNISVAFDDPTGWKIDFYLLNACDPTALLGGGYGTGTLTYSSAPAGTYYVVADTYHGNGKPYTLTLGLSVATSDTFSYVLWSNDTTGKAQVWTVDQNGKKSSKFTLTKAPGWEATSYTGSGPYGYVLWTKPSNGKAQLWAVNGYDGTVLNKFDPWVKSGGWEGSSFAEGPYLLWTKPSAGKANLWYVPSAPPAPPASKVPIQSKAAGWEASSFEAFEDIPNGGFVLWTKPSVGKAQYWLIDRTTGVPFDTYKLSKSAGWQATSAQYDWNGIISGEVFLLWANESTGKAQLWNVDYDGVNLYNAGTLMKLKKRPGWLATSYSNPNAGSGLPFLPFLPETSDGYFKGLPERPTIAPESGLPGRTPDILGETFVELPVLTIKKAGTGNGSILAADERECLAGCDEMRLPYVKDVIETIQVIPDAESVFVGWQTPEGVPVENIYYAQPGDVVIAVFEKQ